MPSKEPTEYEGVQQDAPLAAPIVRSQVRFATPSLPVRAVRIVGALRPTHWTKNFLVFPPLLLGELCLSQHAWQSAIAAFVAFSAIASSTYLLNDIMDRDTDRHHRDKCLRPIARAEVSLQTAIYLAIILLVFGLVIGAAVSLRTSLILASYAALSFGYTKALKQIIFVDCAVLSILLCFRLLAGVVAVGVPLSVFLFGVAAPAFFSMALSKRYAEYKRFNGAFIPGRSYKSEHLVIARRLGLWAAGLAATVFFLYIVMDAYDAKMYVHPSWLWAAPFILLVGIARLWKAASSGMMHSDPLVYAWRDPVAVALATAMTMLFVIATVHSPSQ